MDGCAIAGQSALGEGICLKGHELQVGSTLIFQDTPLPFDPLVENLTARAAYARDAVDARIIAGVRDGTGRRALTIASDAWPELRGMSHEAANDGDGLPDAWEREHGLNPDDGTDAARVAGPEG